MASSEWDLLEKAWKNTQDDDVQTLPGKYKWLGIHLKYLPLMYLRLPQWRFLSATEQWKQWWSGLLTRLVLCFRQEFLSFHSLHLTGWVDQRWQWNGRKVVRNSGFQSSWFRVCHQHKWLKTIFLDQWNCSKLHVKPDQHTWTHPELWPSQTSVQIWSWNRLKNDLISDGKIGRIQIIFLLSNILLP